MVVSLGIVDFVVVVCVKVLFVLCRGYFYEVEGRFFSFISI